MTPEPRTSRPANRQPAPTADRRRWKRFRDASVQIVAWPGTERAQEAEVADESFGGIGLILRGPQVSVGSALELLYNRSPMRAVVRNVALLPAARFRLGCEWEAEKQHSLTLPAELREDLRGGVYLLAALYGQHDWMGLGRAVCRLRQRAVEHDLRDVVAAADLLLDALAQPNVQRAYEGLIDEVVAAVARAEWGPAPAGR